jgi:formamidopyrimidine-DNA glycosylase
MPELPEVETVVRQVEPILLRRKVKRLEVLDPRLDIGYRGSIAGRYIRRVSRRGKQLLIELSGRGRQKNPLWLSIHFRMTGRLLWKRSTSAEDVPHLRARLAIDGGDLLFIDPRRLGTIHLCRSPDEHAPPGLDPLSPGFTVPSLVELLGTGRQEVKPWLLRQDRLAGLGNIYASEILAAARLHPRRTACSLDTAEVRRLHRATRKVLGKAIEHRGTTLSDFRDPRGREGSFEPRLTTYGREGKPCRRCRAPIVRIVQQGRSTFYCPSCQPSSDGS